VRKIITGVFAIVLVAGLGTFAWKASAADEPAAQADDKGMAESAAPAEGAADGSDPLALALSTPVGQLHNPYNNKIAEIAQEGHDTYYKAGCNGCHGGGGGGMCPPLTNEAWNYGSTDDALFRLIVLGSNCKEYEHCVEEQGMIRKAREAVSFPMPAQGQLSKNSRPGQHPALTDTDKVWKIIAWIRSINPSSLTDEDKAAE